MNTDKVMYIIPGYKHVPTNKAYIAIAKMLKNQGYRTILVKIPWKQTTISENTAYFLKQYKRIQTKKKYILGFSFGAMIAFIASTKVKTSGLILCSLSPYFKEDIAKVDTDWISSLTTQRYEDFLGLRCSILAKQIKTKQILMLYGAKETGALIKRVNKAYNQISSTHKYLFPIQGTEHNIGDKRYLYSINLATQTLL